MESVAYDIVLCNYLGGTSENHLVLNRNGTAAKVRTALTAACGFLSSQVRGETRRICAARGSHWGNLNIAKQICATKWDKTRILMKCARTKLGEPPPPWSANTYVTSLNNPLVLAQKSQMNGIA